MLTELKNKICYSLLHPYFSLVNRLIVGSVFLFAGISKINYTSLLISGIEKYEIISGNLAILLGRFLPPLEIVLGFFLIAGVLLKASICISGLLVLSFTISKITAIARGLEITVCPCFGPAMPLFELHSLATNLVMILLILQILLQKDNLLSLDALFLTENKPMH